MWLRCLWYWWTGKPVWVSDEGEGSWLAVVVFASPWLIGLRVPDHVPQQSDREDEPSTAEAIVWLPMRHVTQVRESWRAYEAARLEGQLGPFEDEPPSTTDDPEDEDDDSEDDGDMPAWK